MKNRMVVFFMLLSACLSLHAQQPIEEVQKVNYYGVDFSKVKIFRGKESVKEFQTAFNAINKLTLAEDKKYNFEKFFKKEIEKEDLAVAEARNVSHAPVMLPKKTSSRELKAIRLSPEEVNEIIRDYGNNDEGVGVVIIAVLLNKNEPEAIYEVVFFDVKTKNILFEKQVTGKAGGAGLRNFWANSLHDAVKGWKYKIK